MNSPKEIINNESLNKRMRRSKHDFNGRNKQCSHCEKSYLSEIALNNHIKVKHPNMVENASRPRGRPRKNEIFERSGGVEDISHFFDNSIRKKTSEDDYDIAKVCKENFDNIYNKYKDKLFTNISSPDDYKMIKSHENIPKSIDLAFWEYLLDCSTKANREYFDFIFKFIVLFRESINKDKGNANFSSTEESSECIPDMCNSFVGVFMEDGQYYGLDSNELILIIQHCCFWLWEKHFTTSKLSLC